MFHVPEKYRLLRKQHPMGTDASDGNNGAFIIPHEKIANYFYKCVASDGGGWNHVSVSLMTTDKKKKIERCPTWGEMCFIKSTFWEGEDYVMQVHPPESQYVNNHPYCLHLWQPQLEKIPEPLPEMVGIVGMKPIAVKNEMKIIFQSPKPKK